ncbi:MFS transporter [Catenulispora yoronensis]
MAAPAAPAAPDPGARSHSLLRHNPRFRRFFAGYAVSELGDRITEVALPAIAVITLKADASQVGLLGALVWLPSLAGVFLGAWVDRQRRKRRLMIAADLARAAILLSLPFAALFGAVTMAQLYVVAGLCGLAEVVFHTAYPVFFTGLVSRADYVQANGRLAVARSGAAMAGPPLAGLLLQAASAAFAVVADAASFVVSALAVGRSPVAEPLPDAPEESVLRRSREGMVYIARHRLLRSTLACASTINFFTFFAFPQLLLFATSVLHLSVGAYGVAMGFGAVGALLGAAFVPRLVRVVGVGPGLAAGAVLLPAPIALAAVAHGPVWLCGVLLAGAEFLSGFGVMLFDITINSLQAAVIADAVRSRVSGAYTTVNYGLRPLGALLGGVLAAHAGLRTTLLVAGGGATAACWLLMAPVLPIRSLERDLPPAPATASVPATRSATRPGAE